MRLLVERPGPQEPRHSPTAARNSVLMSLSLPLIVSLSLTAFTSFSHCCLCLSLLPLFLTAAASVSHCRCLCLSVLLPLFLAASTSVSQGLCPSLFLFEIVTTSATVCPCTRLGSHKRCPASAVPQGHGTAQNGGLSGLCGTSRQSFGSTWRIHMLVTQAPGASTCWSHTRITVGTN